MTDIIFEELSNEEKILLLRAFDYDVDKEGFVLDILGERISSAEFPKKFIHLDNAGFIPGSLKVIDGTPTSISKFIREKVEQNNDRGN